MVLATRPTGRRKRPGVLFRAELQELRALQLLAQRLDNSSPDESQLQIGRELFRLPPTLRAALIRVAANLARGAAVTIAAQGTELTTQAAAELLGISRPRLIQLLDSEQIAVRREGSHRRVRLEDVLALRQKRIDQYRRGLQALQALTDEETAAGFDQ